MQRPLLHGRAPYEPLRPWERTGILALLSLLLAFGFVTLHRSAFLDSRRTDADVYFRAAWALRTDQDPYTVADTNGWTYLYPPPLAIGTMPLAQPPPWGPGTENRLHWGVTYPVAIVLWYALSAALLLCSVHWLALALERCSPHALTRNPGFCTRRWWVNRVGPLLFCLPAVCSTLVRGQVNILLLACVCGVALLLSRKRPLAAGAAIAAAVCLKLFPAFLLLQAAITRSGRLITGCLLGCVALLGVLPLAILGWEHSVTVTRSFMQTMLLPALGIGGSDAKHDELARAFNNQSLLAILHNWRDWRSVTVDHIIRPNATDKSLFLLIAAVLVGSVVAAAFRAGLHRPNPPLRKTLLLLCVLTTLMLALSPVCHNHYFALHLPLLACLFSIAQDRARTIDMSPPVWVGLAAYFLLGVLPRLPGLETVLKPAGLHMLVGLALTAVGIWKLNAMKAT
ncbi:MAG: glycosyltransferase family 87 protein [Phycisphaerales bacterium]